MQLLLSRIHFSIVSARMKLPTNWKSLVKCYFNLCDTIFEGLFKIINSHVS